MTTEQHMTTETTGWEARTTSPTETPRPSRTAQATRSLVAADRLTGTARTEALRRHFEEFPPAIGSVCRAWR